jgi:hypothetical protein
MIPAWRYFGTLEMSVADGEEIREVTSKGLYTWRLWYGCDRDRTLWVVGPYSVT